MRERRADKASEANAAESNAVLQALMGQQSGATGTAGAGNPQAPDSRSAIIAALSNPYLSDDVRKFAGQEYQRLNPKLPAPTELQRNYEWLQGLRSEEHTSELQSLMRISYAVFCLKKKRQTDIYTYIIKVLT